MPADEIILRHGTQVNRPFGSFTAFNAYLTPDETIEVKISVHSDTEYKQWIRIGDTFPVRDQTWKLDQVENPGQENWIVHLIRIA